MNRGKIIAMEKKGLRTPFKSKKRRSNRKRTSTRSTWRLITGTCKLSSTMSFVRSWEKTRRPSNAGSHPLRMRKKTRKSAK